MGKGKHVIVRTYSAGVWYGLLIEQDGKEVRLQDARRIWRWRGANTCSELALHGCDSEYSRVAEPVSVALTEAIEIIDATEEAADRFAACAWE